MKKLTRSRFGPLALLVLLALLTVLFVMQRRKTLVATRPEYDTHRAVGRLQDAAVRDKRAAGAVVAGVVLLGFVTWIAIRARGREEETVLPAQEASANSTKAIH